MLRVFVAWEVLAGFIHDGNFPKLYSSEVRESVSRLPLGFVVMRDLFLRRYYVLHPKFLHEAQVEHQGAIIDSLHIVGCRYMVIFRVLG